MLFIRCLFVFVVCCITFAGGYIIGNNISVAFPDFYHKNVDMGMIIGASAVIFYAISLKEIMKGSIRRGVASVIVTSGFLGTDAGFSLAGDTVGNLYFTAGILIGVIGLLFYGVLLGLKHEWLKANGLL